MARRGVRATCFADSNSPETGFWDIWNRHSSPLGRNAASPWKCGPWSRAPPSWKFGTLHEPGMRCTRPESAVKRLILTPMPHPVSTRLKGSQFHRYGGGHSEENLPFGHTTPVVRSADETLPHAEFGKLPSNFNAKKYPPTHPTGEARLEHGARGGYRGRIPWPGRGRSQRTRDPIGRRQKAKSYQHPNEVGRPLMARQPTPRSRTS